MTRLLLAAFVVLTASCAPEDSTEVVPAVAQPLSDAQFAGRTENTNLFAAVITSSAGIEAYFCDNTVDFWFRGTGTADSVMELEDASGATLLLQLADGRMFGRLTTSDGTETNLELPSVQGEVLFRAESALGEERVLGGWIKLPDGEQRGAIRIGSNTVASAIVNGDVQCAACAPLSLLPAAFTPEATAKRANVQQRVTIIGLGDSYMSGEGSPVVDGELMNNGTVGTQESWSNGLPQSVGFTFTLDATTRTRLAREARACHRGSAGLGLAIADLQRTWPFVSLVHQTFACSGAQVKNAIDTTYGGPGGCASLSGAELTSCLAVSDDTPLPTIQAQLPEALAFVRSQGLSMDAVVMSLGGNDLGFGDIIADCLSSTGRGCEAADSDARDALAEGSAALPGQYDRLATALSNANLPDSSIYIAQYLSPLRRTASDNCSGFEFDDALLRFIADEEGVFAGTVHSTMNTLVSQGASRNGWKLISSHIGTEVGHSMCNTTPWFNDTQTALRTQGADLPRQGPFGAVKVTAGMVHPNRSGHRDGYRPAYVTALDAMLRKRFTLSAPTKLRVTKMSLENGRGRVTLSWDDLSPFESNTTIRDAAGLRVTSARADVTSTEILLDGTTGSFQVEACLANPEICSPRSNIIDVEVKRPDVRPISVSAALTVVASNINPRQIALTWDDKVPSRMYSTLEIDTGTSVVSRAVESQKVLLPETQALKRFRVAACNDLGCGPVSAWVNFSRPPINVLPPCENPVLNGCLAN